MTFDDAMGACGLVAILRGIRPDEAVTIGEILIAEGFRIIEVPLNSPQPLQSIERLVDQLGNRAIIGAGTVLTARQVSDVAATGARLVVSPNTDPDVIKATRRTGMISLPGAATPSEAFSAVNAGAHAVKAFPAEIIPSAAIKAWRAVLPENLPVLPVGGITPDSLSDYRKAGASGFGLGSALYKPGVDAAAIATSAKRFVQAYAALGAPT